MNQQELKNVLELHRKWVMNEDGGQRADLSYADLSYADLRSADLSSANLSYADLRSADLSYANLSYADLRSADLSSANLSSADLSSADLSSANLSYADLSYADLRSADLRSADLREIREDFFKRMMAAKGEINGLYDAILRGKIAGSSYQGKCACFIGTIANLRKENYQNLSIDLRPDADSLTEKWFLAIREGDVPRSNAVSKVAKLWIEEFAQEHGLVLPKYKLVSSDKFPAVFSA